MGSRGIRKIDLCDDCLEKKAEHLLWDFSLWTGSICRLLCTDCAKTRHGKVDWVREKWGN